MKKVYLKVTSLAILSSVMLATLAGCGDKKASSAESKGTDSSKAVTLKVEVFDRGTTGQTPPTDNYWTKWIKEKVKKDLNIDVEFYAVPRTQEVDKLNIDMAANQAADVSFTYDVNVVYNYVKNGGLTDLTSSLDKNGADLKKFLSDDVIKMGNYNGKQFAIPAKRSVTAKFATYMRKDWLDKLNMTAPKTTDEFYNALKAFKDKNPGGVDKVIPLSMTYDVEWTASLILEAFKQKATDEEAYVNAPFLVPGYKDGVRYVNKLYNEGLIAPEFPLDKEGKNAKSQISRGQVGSIIGNYDDPLRTTAGTNDMMKNVPGSSFIPVDTFTNPNYDNKTRKSLYDPAGLRVFVPKVSSEKAEAAIKYLNWMTKNENMFFLQFGEQGVGHELVDGVPKVKAVEGEKKFNTQNNLDYTPIVNGVDLGDKEKNKKVLSLSYPGFEKQFIQAFDIATTNGYIPPSLPVPVDAEAKYGKTLKEKGYEMYAKMVTAKPADFDKVWDTCIQEWLKIGGQEVIDQRKAAWKDANTKK